MINKEDQNRLKVEANSIKAYERAKKKEDQNRLKVEAKSIKAYERAKKKEAKEEQLEVSSRNTIKAFVAVIQGTLISGGTVIMEKQCFDALSNGKFSDCEAHSQYSINVDSLGRKNHKIDCLFINHKAKKIAAFDCKSDGWSNTVDQTHGYANHIVAKKNLSEQFQGYNVNYSILKVGGHSHEVVEALGILTFDLEEYCGISIENNGWVKLLFKKLKSVIRPSNIESNDMLKTNNIIDNLERYLNNIQINDPNKKAKSLDQITARLMELAVHHQLRVNGLI